MKVLQNIKKFFYNTALKIGNFFIKISKKIKLFFGKLKNTKRKNKSEKSDDFYKNYYTSSNENQTDNQEEKKTKNNENQNYANSENTVNSTNTTSLSIKTPAHIFDLIAGLIFIITLIIALKPEFCTKITTFGISDENSFLSTIGHRFEILLFTVTEKDLMIRNVIVFFGLLFFTIFKILTISFSKTKNIIVSVLVFSLTIFTCFFIKEKFIAFLIYIIVFYFIFEFSCNFKLPVILKKIAILSVSFVILYFILHFLAYDWLINVFAINNLILW